MNPAAALLLFFLAGCASVPINDRAATRTAELWADVGIYHYPPPSVTVITVAEMAKMRDAPHGWVAATYRCDIRAMYVSRDHTTVDDVWLDSLLVHELTHHNQCLSGKMRTGKKCELEVEAYQAQIAWLNKRGEELGALMGTDARNYARYVDRHMRKTYSACL